jgi:hypothetical protein
MIREDLLRIDFTYYIYFKVKPGFSENSYLTVFIIYFCRLSFEGALSDDGCSEDSGFDRPRMMSPHSSSSLASPEPDLQEILTG